MSNDMQLKAFKKEVLIMLSNSGSIYQYLNRLDIGCPIFCMIWENE